MKIINRSNKSGQNVEKSDKKHEFSKQTSERFVREFLMRYKYWSTKNTSCRVSCLKIRASDGNPLEFRANFNNINWIIYKSAKSSKQHSKRMNSWSWKNVFAILILSIFVQHQRRLHHNSSSTRISTSVKTTAMVVATDFSKIIVYCWL